MVQAKTASVEVRPKTPDASKRGNASRAGSCFGGGPPDGDDPDSSVTVAASAPSDDGKETLLPAGLVGLRNIGIPPILCSVVNFTLPPLPPRVSAITIKSTRFTSCSTSRFEDPENAHQPTNQPKMLAPFPVLIKKPCPTSIALQQRMTRA